MRSSNTCISLTAVLAANILLLTTLPTHAETLSEPGNTIADKERPIAPVEVTGQRKCWDVSGNLIPCAGTGQDGELQAGVKWPTPRFTVNRDGNGTPDGTVTDNLTGLIWLRNADCFDRQPWTKALLAANNLKERQCGLKDGSKPGDWRLPNIKELQSLLNYGRVSPALPSNHPFTDVRVLDYWSSTNFVGNPGNAFIIFTDVGSVFDIPKVGARFVWPVRDRFDTIAGKKRPIAPVEVTGQTECWNVFGGNPISCIGTGQDGELQAGVKWPTPRFTVNRDGNGTPDGTVTDNLTGLIWLRNANCFDRQTWIDALSAANNLAEGQCGLGDGSKPGDWRLSNIKELQSLLDYGKSDPALPSGHPFTGFDIVQFFDYWSSTTFAGNRGSTLLIVLNFGIIFDVTKDDGFRRFLWPVRGGQCCKRDH